MTTTNDAATGATGAAIAMTTDEIGAVVRATSSTIRQHYVFPDVAARIVAVLDETLVAGGYDELWDAEALGVRVTRDLQSVNGDKHLRLQFHEAGSVDEVDEAAWLAAYTAEAESAGHGVASVQRLSAAVAVLDLSPKLYHPMIAGDSLSAAMRLVATAPALVIDLRGCIGGSPETVALICSYLFEDEAHLTDQLTNDPDGLRQWWTLPWVPGPKSANNKLAVLTSRRTFSGGEDLAYTLQQAGRATIVGEVTGGGAHPRRGFTVHSHLEVTVPVAYSRNSNSKTNWEGVGIQPDLPCEAADALTTAVAFLTAGVAG